MGFRRGALHRDRVEIAMTIETAFLSPGADDLFESVAAFANATELETLDVAEGQSDARKAIGLAMENAVRRRPNPAARIALIKGDAGSGKTHVLTTIFKKAAAIRVAEFYPAILQLTAPVATADYEKWLLDAAFRELTARHFPDHLNCSGWQITCLTGSIPMVETSLCD
jgi:hypothetical protein